MKYTQTTSEDEKTLIQAAQAGDLEAFNALILRYQNLLFGIALRMLNDEDTASDAVQEALISAFSRFSTFRGGSLRSWLARVVVNACYDEMRRMRRQHTIPLEPINSDSPDVEEFLWMIDATSKPEEQVESFELEGALQRSLELLTPAYREAVVLVDIEGLSYEEAAIAAHVPVGTVKSRLARARMQMRDTLRGIKDLLPSHYVMEIPQFAHA